MYEKHILRILWDVGARGISMKKLAKHVYNLSCTLFSQPDFDEVYRYTVRYVQRNARTQQGLVEHAQKWGHYRISRKNAASARQKLQELGVMQEDGNEQKEEKPAADLSLSLFD